MGKTLTRLTLVVATALLLASMAWAAPISVYPQNPHYFLYRGKPILLITSDQHYGAVVNSEFDYVAFLDKPHSKGLNFTRIYPGAYFEKENDYLPGNNLGPRAGKQVLPWARTTITGGSPVLGGYKFDLDRWDPAYFDRLKDFCAKAQDRDIIVEICPFNGVDVKTGGASGNLIEVFGDLQEGDEVAVRGTSELRPEMPVAARSAP
jgi:hypothetical protein